MPSSYAVMQKALIWCMLGFATPCLPHLMPYSASSFRGDGTIRDSGSWTYPRYQIAFAEIPGNRSGKHVYAVKGLPTQLTFCLQVLRSDKDTDLSVFVSKLRSVTSSATVEVKITSASGDMVCEHSSPLSDWELSVSANRVAFWH